MWNEQLKRFFSHLPSVSPFKYQQLIDRQGSQLMSFLMAWSVLLCNVEPVNLLTQCKATILINKRNLPMARILFSPHWNVLKHIKIYSHSYYWPASAQSTMYFKAQSKLQTLMMQTITHDRNSQVVISHLVWEICGMCWRLLFSGVRLKYKNIKYKNASKEIS